jgi:general stress protein 26
MAREEDTGKSQRQLKERVWDLAESIRVCMFITRDGATQSARPLDSTVRKDEHAVYFLTDVSGKKVAQIKKSSNVTVAFSDPGSFKFVSITGTAKVSNDRAKIKDIWTATSKAWWDSADDPAIRLVTFVPKNAELWDSPNKLVSTVLMLTAAITGAKPKLGDHAKVAIPSG